MLFWLGCYAEPAAPSEPEACATKAYNLRNYHSATCRSDQDGAIAWPPVPLETRDEISPILLCTCRDPK